MLKKFFRNTFYLSDYAEHKFYFLLNRWLLLKIEFHKMVFMKNDFPLNEFHTTKLTL
jgi:hypothetical protein